MAATDPLYEDRFTIDDTEFKLKPLTNEQRLGLLPDIARILAPIFGASDLSEEAAAGVIESAANGIARLPAVHTAFARQCSWRRTDSDAFVTVGWDTCFQRRTLLQLRWMLRCVRLEFGDFLDANGLAALADEAKELFSQTS